MYKTTGVGKLLLVLFILSGCAVEKPEKELIYVASAEGLFVLDFDRANKTFNQLQQVTERTGGYQAIHPNGKVLYTISETRSGPDGNYSSVVAYKIDPDTGLLSFLNMQSTEGVGAAHVSTDPQGRFVYVSNYGGGSLSSFPVTENGSLEKAVSVVRHTGSSINQDRQAQPHVHSAIPSHDGRFVYASDLGTDKVNIYAVHQGTGELTPAETPFVDIEPGSGPRHFTIHPTENYAYSIDELSSTITVLSVDRETGALSQIQRVDMLPEDFDGTSYSSDIHISPDGDYLYAANRGHDSMAIYSIDKETGRLAILGHEPTRGGYPWNFAVDTFGEYLFASNRDDGNLVLFERDADTGLLAFTGSEMEFPGVTCVTQHVFY